MEGDGGGFIELASQGTLDVPPDNMIVHLTDLIQKVDTSIIVQATNALQAIMSWFLGKHIVWLNIIPRCGTGIAELPLKVRVLAGRVKCTPDDPENVQCLVSFKGALKFTLHLKADGEAEQG